MRKIKLGILFRNAQIDRSAIDEKSRTAKLSFSSETPVDRWYGKEILDHKPESVVMGRMLNSAPLLMDHNSRDQVGVIESASIAQKRGSAEVRFGNSVRATEVFDDVKNGIRPHVSVGYRVHDMVLESQDGDEKTYRVTSWEPMEISIVAIGADDSVGIGRSDNGEMFEATISNEDEPAKDGQNMLKRHLLFDPAAGALGAGGGGAASAAGTVPVTETQNESSRGGGVTFTRAEVIASARKEELKRVQEINRISAKVSQRVRNISELTKTAIDGFQSVDDFRAVVFDNMEGVTPIANPDPNIGMGKREIESFSFVRAIQNSVAVRDGKKAPHDFEREVCETARGTYRRQVQGENSFIVPHDVLSYRADSGTWERTQITTTGSLGGNLVATNLLAGSFIDLLRNRMMVARMGATILDGLVGNIAIPRQSGASTLYWATSEVASTTASSATFDQVSMSPKQATAEIDYSWLTLQQTTPSIEGLLRNDLNAVIARGIDLAALHGSGSSGQPTGIASVSGIGSVTGGSNGAIVTWANVVGLEGAVANANADFGALGYLTNSRQRTRLKQTLKNSTGTDATFIWSPNMQSTEGFGEMNGYRAGVSNQVSNTLTKGTASTTCSAIFFANWADLIIAQWGGMEFMADPYSQGPTRIIRLFAYQALDINVRHPESFAAMLDALP